jgi:chromate reductase
MDLADISAIPLYNEEIREQGLPASVLSLREQILKADALVIATPEYNYSMPGVLKNAIDWASRPPSQPFEGKPIALMSASPGGFGGARAQYQLRQVFIYLNGLILNRPEAMISAAHTKFDAQGGLTDPTAAEPWARRSHDARGIAEPPVADAGLAIDLAADGCPDH